MGFGFFEPHGQTITAMTLNTQNMTVNSNEIVKEVMPFSMYFIIDDLTYGHFTPSKATLLGKRSVGNGRELEPFVLSISRGFKDGELKFTPQSIC